MDYLGGDSRRHHYWNKEVRQGNKECKSSKVHYLASSDRGHLGFSNPGDHRSCAEHASELRKLECLFSNLPEIIYSQADPKPRLSKFLWSESALWLAEIADT